MSGPPRPSSSDASRPPLEAATNVTYAFDDAHKESFRALATSMSFVGACTILFGGLTFIVCAGELYAGFIPSAIGTAIGAVLCLVTGWWMTSAGRSLSALVGTRGRDLDLLMEAVSQLRRLFGLARLVIVVVALIAVAGGGLIVWCTLIMERGGKCFGLWV